MRGPKIDPWGTPILIFLTPKKNGTHTEEKIGRFDPISEFRSCLQNVSFEFAK